LSKATKVAFRRLRREGRRDIEPIYPVLEDFQEDSESLLFWRLKESLVKFGNDEAGEFIVKPVVDFWP
jgi:hypothetical protein